MEGVIFMAEQEDPGILETMLLGPAGMIAFSLGHTAMAGLLQDVLRPLDGVFTTLENDHPKAFEAVKDRRDQIVLWIEDFADLIGAVYASGGLDGIFVGNTFQLLDVNAVLDGALAAVGECASFERINITKSYQSPLPGVFGNKALLELAFWHLIMNAVEAVAGGGSITLETRLYCGDSIKIEISDNGCGVPKRIRPQALFRMGCTTKKDHAGLGLSIATLVVFAHDGFFCLGDIDASSAAAEGTTFTVTLPDV